MITCPPAIQTQLGEAISLIADSDFWERWQTLVSVCYMTKREALEAELLTESTGSCFALDA